MGKTSSEEKEMNQGSTNEEIVRTKDYEKEYDKNENLEDISLKEKAVTESKSDSEG